jgi:hypothetical protein
MAFVVGAEAFACLFDREKGRYHAGSLGTVTAVTLGGVSCGGVQFDPEDEVFPSLKDAEAAAASKNALRVRLATELPSSPEH